MGLIVRHLEVPASYRKTPTGNDSQGRQSVSISCVRLIPVGTWIPRRQVDVNEWRILMKQQPARFQSTGFASPGGLEGSLLCTWCWERLGWFSEQPFARCFE